MSLKVQLRGDQFQAQLLSGMLPGGIYIVASVFWYKYWWLLAASTLVCYCYSIIWGKFLKSCEDLVIVDPGKGLAKVYHLPSNKRGKPEQKPAIKYKTILCWLTAWTIAYTVLTPICISDTAFIGASTFIFLTPCVMLVIHYKLVGYSIQHFQENISKTNIQDAVDTSRYQRRKNDLSA